MLQISEFLFINGIVSERVAYICRVMHDKVEDLLTKHNAIATDMPCLAVSFAFERKLKDRTEGVYGRRQAQAGIVYFFLWRRERRRVFHIQGRE